MKLKNQIISHFALNNDLASLLRNYCNYLNRIALLLIKIDLGKWFCFSNFEYSKFGLACKDYEVVVEECAAANVFRLAKHKAIVIHYDIIVI